MRLSVSGGRDRGGERLVTAEGGDLADGAGGREMTGGNSGRTLARVEVEGVNAFEEEVVVDKLG